jgi:maltooligosyltrehalose trehalohydrolase
MAKVGHFHDEQGRSVFRIFAPRKRDVAVLLVEDDAARSPKARLTLEPDEIGYWHAQLPRLPHGTLYLIEIDGRRWPDPASRCQPHGVHGPSMVVEFETVRSPGWKGVAIGDAIVYELHLGTYTPEGTLAAAQGRLAHLAALGINVVELLPVAAFPGERNWGYDGTYPYALQRDYGSHHDLVSFIEAAHRHGIAVVLDLVCNHFGPEGNYSGEFAPYAKAAATPWGAAINFDGAYNHGVREFFLENARYWLSEVGFDGLRMDAVSLVFDDMPVHILREFTDLARAIELEAGRCVLMIAEHLRNDRSVTAPTGHGFHTQWNDDLNYALHAFLTGERHRHCINFGAFDDIVKALRDGFVLDGSRFDRYWHWFLGTDGRKTEGREHLVHIQNHDQIGNRPFGDRLIASHGRDRALLAITAIMASPYVPMLFMGEEYGETAPFLFFEDFADAAVIDGVRAGRKADYDFGGVEPPDPHARASFEASKLRWAQAETPTGRAILAYYQGLIALKRSGELGPRDKALVTVSGDPVSQVITVQTPHTCTAMNFSGARQQYTVPAGWVVALDSAASGASVDPGQLAPHGAVVLKRTPPVEPAR